MSDTDKKSSKKPSESAIYSLQNMLDKQESFFKKLEKYKEDFENTKVFFRKRKEQALEQEEKIRVLEEKLNNKAREAVDVGSNDNIEGFVNDIAPFFTNKSITYVDIGAYIGEVFIKLKKFKKINIRQAHLFEPNPESYSKLVDNLTDYKTSSLHVHNVAIGEKKDKATFSSSLSMTKVVSHKPEEKVSTNYFDCNIFPLGDFKNSITEGHIHILKLDVEGEDLNVLEGAKDFLCEQKIDVIYVEVGFNKLGKQQTYFCDIDKKLQGYGYRVFKIYEQRNEWIEDIPLLRRCNVAFMSETFAKNNPYKLTIERNNLKSEVERLKNQ